MKRLATIFGVVFACLLGASVLYGAIDCDQSVTFNIASGSTATTATPQNQRNNVKICAIGVTGTTATTSDAVRGTTITIASNSVTKATYVIGTQPLALGSGSGVLFQGEAGFAVVLTCGTGTCSGTISYTAQ